MAAIHLLVDGALSLTETLSISPAQGVVTATVPVTVPPTATGNQVVKVSVQAEDASGNRTPALSHVFAIRDRFSPVVALELPPG